MDFNLFAIEFVKKQKRLDEICKKFENFVLENEMNKEEISYLIKIWHGVLEKEEKNNDSNCNVY